MAGSGKYVACNHKFALWGYQQSLTVVPFTFAEKQSELFIVIVMFKLVMRWVRKKYREIFECAKKV